MPHLPFTPNHVLLISACYPNTAALLAANADLRPNNQELSRLTYYAANRPGKINKLGSELEKRAVAEARKAKTGNARARACVLTSCVPKSLLTFTF
jgi:protein EFR3